jgi:hypothetical protein
MMIDREPRGEDPLLLLKMTLFFAAAAVAIAGMVTQRPWLISVGILILAVGFLLRLLRRRPDPAPLDEDEPLDEDAGTAADSDDRGPAGVQHRGPTGPDDPARPEHP